MTCSGVMGLWLVLVGINQSVTQKTWTARQVTFVGNRASSGIVIFSSPSNELYEHSFFHTIFRHGISSLGKNAAAPPLPSSPSSVGQSVFFRVNEAFPAAFSGSLNLMKLRPFQSVSLSVRQPGLARLVTGEGGRRGRTARRSSRKSCGFSSFFPPFSLHFPQCMPGCLYLYPFETSVECNKSGDAHIPIPRSGG